MTDKLSILAVDDEQVILDAVKKMLDPQRFDALTALDAEEGLQILASKDPAILISDLVLPGASGMELLDMAFVQDPALLIIITTGYSTAENAVAALKRGAFDFLPKPFTEDEFLSCVDRARRAGEQRLTPGARTPDADRHGGFHLGVQTWARPENNGTAVLGVTELLTRTVNPIDRIDFPEIDVELRQGGRLVSLLTADGFTHNAWSPLGGLVVACNESLRERPDALRDDPSGAGWLVRIQPANLNAELANLIDPESFPWTRASDQTP